MKAMHQRECSPVHTTVVSLFESRPPFSVSEGGKLARVPDLRVLKPSFLKRRWVREHECCGTVSNHAFLIVSYRRLPNHFFFI
jgi:hypothetical protein